MSSHPTDTPARRDRRASHRNRRAAGAFWQSRHRNKVIAAVVALALVPTVAVPLIREHRANLARERGPSPLDFVTDGPYAPDDNRDQVAVWAENRVVFDVSESQGFTDPVVSDEGATWGAEVSWPAVIDTTNTMVVPGFRARVVWPVVVMTNERSIPARLNVNRVEVAEVPRWCISNIELLGIAEGETADDAAVAGSAVMEHTFGFDTSGLWAVADVSFAPGAEACSLMELLVNYEFSLDAIEEEG